MSKKKGTGYRVQGTEYSNEEDQMRGYRVEGAGYSEIAILSFLDGIMAINGCSKRRAA